MSSKRPAGGAAVTSKRRKAEKEPAAPAPAPTQAEKDLDVLADALLQAEARVSKLLIPMLEHSLAPRDKRHRYQEQVVTMVEGVLGSLEAELRQAIAEVEGRIASSHGKRATLEAAVKDAEAELAARRQESQSRKEALTEDARAFQAAKLTVASAQAGVRLGEGAVAAIAADKGLMESAQTNFAKPLAEGTAGDEAKHLTESLMAVLRKFAFDESMLSALPAALVKEPSSRGPFDTTVLAQLQAELSQRIAGLEGRLKEAEQEKAQSVARLADAEANFDTTRTAQLQSAMAFNAAREEQRKAEEGLEAMKEALTRLDPAAKKLQKELGEAEAHLELFLQGAKKAFERLRDRVSPTVESEVVPMQTEEPKAAEPAADPPAEAPAGEAPTEEKAADMVAV